MHSANNYWLSIYLRKLYDRFCGGKTSCPMSEKLTSQKVPTCIGTLIMKERNQSHEGVRVSGVGKRGVLENH